MATISTMSRFARAMSINTLVLTSIKASLKTPTTSKLGCIILPYNIIHFLVYKMREFDIASSL